jgi:uncharacterized SAM-binding protein YcdF (DUF218 family)
VADLKRSAENMGDAAPVSISPQRWLTTVLIPFVIASVYLWFSRWPTRWFTTASDYIALAVAVAVFVGAVLAMPLERKKKVLIALGGAPVVAAALTVFALVFVSMAFGDWL